jgi:hypothetical protein
MQILLSFHCFPLDSFKKLAAGVIIPNILIGCPALTG